MEDGNPIARFDDLAKAEEVREAHVQENQPRATLQITFCVTSELRALAKRRAAELGLTFSEHVRALLQKDLACPFL
jgi:hypothetical protein